MTNTTARCDHIVALIDACLAEVEATRQPAPMSGSLPTASHRASSPTAHR